jgi:hypothetical protein
MNSAGGYVGGAAGYTTTPNSGSTWNSTFTPTWDMLCVINYLS